jgi:hypothetical protein
LRIVFEQKNWALIFIFSLLVASGLTILLYFRNRDNRDLSAWQNRILIFLRFISLFLLSALLTAPLIRTLRKITELPTLLVAVDNSFSMGGLPGIHDYKPEITAVSEKVAGELGKNFRVVRYTFGEKTRMNGATDFKEKISDYSEMIKTIYDNHFNENIGALVIIGDGNYNQGENPQNGIKKFSFPVYTLGTGDTTSVKDARITDVRVNKTAFIGNQFPVEADISITGGQDSRLRFSVSHEGNKLISKDIEVTSPDFFITLPLTLDAEQKGLQYYMATLEPLPGEQNNLNNSWPFVINVLENKQKVLILSDGSHPDAGVIKETLEQQINYEITLCTAEPYPADLRGYSLIILNQLPSASKSCAVILEQSQKYRIPVLVIIGSGTLLPQLKMLDLGTDIVPLAGDFEEAQPSINDQFVSFTISSEIREAFTKYPPLKVPFASYNLDPDYKIFAFQRIKNIVTAKPLIAMGIRKGIKTGIIFGEGIWRWRIYNHLNSGNDRDFTGWMDKLVQYLAIRDNTDNFTVDFKPVYRETENIQMSAEVYNDLFELINTPEVNIQITDSTNRVFSYSFDHSNQFYRMDAGVFPPGRYQFRAITRIGNKEYTDSGNFAVVPINLEQMDYRANHRSLYQLAHETNGRFFTETEADQLIRTIAENNNIKASNYYQIILDEIIGQRWIFFLFLLFLCAEWFLRKFWGIY